MLPLSLFKDQPQAMGHVRSTFAVMAHQSLNFVLLLFLNLVSIS